MSYRRWSGNVSVQPRVIDYPNRIPQRLSSAVILTDDRQAEGGFDAIAMQSLKSSGGFTAEYIDHWQRIIWLWLGHDHNRQSWDDPCRYLWHLQWTETTKTIQFIGPIKLTQLLQFHWCASGNDNDHCCCQSCSCIPFSCPGRRIDIVESFLCHNEAEDSYNYIISVPWSSLNTTHNTQWEATFCCSTLYRYADDTGQGRNINRGEGKWQRSVCVFHEAILGAGKWVYYSAQIQNVVGHLFPLSWSLLDHHQETS